MKKIAFYTRLKIDGIEKASLKNGWTDGVFNYYSTGDRPKHWRAIVPSIGCAVGRGAHKLADAAREVNTPEMLNLVTRTIEANPHMVQSFVDLVKIAEEE